MGGSVNVKSQINQGSQFEINIKTKSVLKKAELDLDIMRMNSKLGLKQVMLQKESDLHLIQEEPDEMCGSSKVSISNKSPSPK